MPIQQRRLRTYILIAFAAVVVSFVAATFYSEHRARLIERSAFSIKDDAAASILHLSAARTELRRLQLLADNLVDAASDRKPTSPDEVTRARARMDREIEAYLALPADPGEAQTWNRANEILQRVNGDLDRVLALVRAGDAPGAQTAITRLHADADQLADATYEAIRWNAEEAQQLALEIRRIRRQSTELAYGLDAFGVVLAGFAAAMSLRAVREANQLLERHNRFVESRANELEAFGARIAHDIRSPLTTVSLVLDRIGRTHGSDEKTKLAAERGLGSVAQVTRLVEDLLAFARAGARPEPGAHAELATVVKGVVEQARASPEAAGADLRVGPLPEGAVACSPGALISVLSNLVLNALRYTEESPVRRVEVRGHREGGAVVLEVEDSGPGLPAELDEKTVFDLHVRGRRARMPGLGLGLATVKRIAEGHDGQAGVRSSAQGCCFWVRLPGV
jgi:signal transduction histidine kinase